MPPKDAANIEKVLKLNECLIDYFSTNLFADGMVEDSALAKAATEAIYDLSGRNLDEASNIALDDLGIEFEDFANLYPFAEAAAKAMDVLRWEILKASPLFPNV